MKVWDDNYKIGINDCSDCSHLEQIWGIDCCKDYEFKCSRTGESFDKNYDDGIMEDCPLINLDKLDNLLDEVYVYFDNLKNLESKEKDITALLELELNKKSNKKISINEISFSRNEGWDQDDICSFTINESRLSLDFLECLSELFDTQGIEVDNANSNLQVKVKI